ncbi:SH3 type 3 domain-containing protein [Brucella intermedia LMG 3301]|uniref:SH3 type 3 domain-containing protein n=5 Tax=Brucella TaxID=234 RepID=C4WEY6_9HYPH|nr:SH3 type 3 domain-containing protein [Brucella intermedia LMG 3301]
MLSGIAARLPSLEPSRADGVLLEITTGRTPMKLALKAALVALGVFAAGAAQAANAISTTNLNIRTGPGTRYATLGSIPSGAPVTVRGCTAGYGWCQVSYGPTFGWASSRYLAFREGTSGGYSDDFGRTAALIGIPLIAGLAIGSALNDRDDYWYRDRRYYRNRHWDRRDWRDRPRWHGNHGPRVYLRQRGPDGPHGQ